MKKQIALATAILAMGTLVAQNASVDQFFAKYEGQEGFTSVNVSETLFEWVATAAEESDEWKSVVEGIKGVRILVYENTENDARSGQLYQEFMSSSPATGYEELMDVTSDNEKVKLYGRNIEGSVLQDMLLVCDADAEFVLISIVGAIDLKSISKIADMDIEGLDELKKLEQENIEEDK